MALALDTVNTLNGTKSAAAQTAAVGQSGQGTAETFLKLLVTQMQNQDPLNPMDNAQVTSQIAQINTVTGIQSLNTTVAGLGAQFTQLQALQGVSLVGRDVTLEGNTLPLGAMTSGQQVFQWAGNAQPDGAYTFRVTATAGAASVASTPLVTDKVQAVSLAGNKLMLDTLHSGSVDYSAVISVN